MEIALFLIGLAVGVLVVTGVAGRIGVPAPFVLIVVGAAASYLPGLPEVRVGRADRRALDERIRALADEVVGSG